MGLLPFDKVGDRFPGPYHGRSRCGRILYPRFTSPSRLINGGRSGKKGDQLSGPRLDDFRYRADEVLAECDVILQHQMMRSAGCGLKATQISRPATIARRVLDHFNRDLWSLRSQAFENRLQPSPSFRTMRRVLYGYAEVNPAQQPVPWMPSLDQSRREKNSRLR